MAINTDTTVRKLIAMPKTLAEEVSVWRHEQRIWSEAEAVRKLIQRGLQAMREDEVRAAPKKSR